MDHSTTRRRFLSGVGTAGIVGVGGCAGRDDEQRNSPTSESGDEQAGEPTRPGTTDADSAAKSTGEPAIADQSLYLSYTVAELESATTRGAGKDQIPSIDDPTVAPPAELTLSDEMTVFGVVRNGVARAYPRRLLVYHEIVNDRIGGDSVAITYCPLTGTTLGFQRDEATFGVSGLLINNNLVMYDRTTETLWPQIPATGIDGPLAGSSLREFPIVWTSLGAWRDRYPETTVLTESTGYARRYGQDPYDGGYETHPLDPSGFYSYSQTLYPTLTEIDDRLDKVDIVVGVRTTSGALAFERTALHERGLLTGEIDGESLLAAYDVDLDAVYVYRNPESQEFDYADGTVVDGDGTEHSPANLPLERIMAFEAMWFAWYGYYPDTGLVT
jgi:hypothetical protein